MIMGGNNDDDGHRNEFYYNVHDYDYGEDKYYKDDDRHHTQVKFSWLVDNQEVEGGVDRPHLLILPGLTRLVDEDRNDDYDHDLYIRNDNGAIVKCQASNSIGKSEETTTLDIFCEFIISLLYHHQCYHHHHHAPPS